MKKRVLLIGYNFYPEPTGIGKYSGEMIKWLAEKGYDCTVITTYPYYPYWKVQEPYHKNRFWYSTELTKFPSGGSIKLYRCPMYVPAKPSGLKRILLDFSFLVTGFFKLIQLLPAKKFDFVVTVVPSFQFGILGALYKKFRGAKFMYHIQDMQIEAARDLQMIKSEKAINALLGFEKYIFDKADYVSSISEGMVARIQEKAKKDIFLLPNWADVNLFHPVEDKASIKVDFGFAPTDKIVLYSGAIGEKQGLEAILYAAKEFQQQTSVKFIICGSGPYKEKLQNLANELKLTNLSFLPLQPFEKFNQFLNLADIHLVIQKATASDLVMPSKLTTILSVGGLALITANPGSGLHSLVQKYDMGLLVEAENQQALNEGLRKALAQDTSQQRKNARAYAERYLSIDKIMESFEELMQRA
ncbi:WcaI family glycosyltransferase [Hymenobacter sp. GOD-10R]|uniref:WcaI family glycosyltransferase n=1 Tax=Hymenobacter sp. GOD-10R TaxID=3093922 RepID=UPI002D769C01|nr:WcaI family glycosyltransferase [Hymenobacter sp. GOD-10R]WRQ28046.1 WcaI family glycosyltransferase [Hymenobacter sp. GOD-10R]